MEPQEGATTEGASPNTQTQADANASTAASSTASTTATSSGSGAQTLADVVTAAAEASPAKGSDGKGSGTNLVPDGNEPPKEGAKEESTDPNVATESDDPDKALPFAEHPRWKEVYGKMKDSERELDTFKAKETEWKPFVEAQQATNNFCQQNRITVQQYRDILDIQALINTDPSKAFARLEPLYNRLAALSGKAPDGALDQDLQEAIRTGKLDQEWARQVQASRAQQSFVQERARFSEADQARFVENANSEAVAQWARDLATRDTAFKPAANGTKGVFELTTSFLGDLCRRTPPRTPVEATKLAQQAYDDARKVIAPTVIKPRPVGGKTLPPNGSSAKTKTMPKNLADVVTGVANGSLRPGDISDAAA